MSQAEMDYWLQMRTEARLQTRALERIAAALEFFVEEEKGLDATLFNSDDG